MQVNNRTQGSCRKKQRNGKNTVTRERLAPAGAKPALELWPNLSGHSGPLTFPLYDMAMCHCGSQPHLGPLQTMAGYEMLIMTIWSQEKYFLIEVLTVWVAFISFEAPKPI